MLRSEDIGRTTPTIWPIDNLTSIGGHSATVIGAPSTSSGTLGNAVCFDGANDGLLVNANPIQGFGQFTIEVLFFPEAHGDTEQRFVHVQEQATESRALVELRSVAENWYLDTYLHAPTSQLTLITPGNLHPNGKWYWAALCYDGVTMRHCVNGVEEAKGPVTFAPLGAGRTSLGVRQNQVSWFRGRLRELRVSPVALLNADLQRTSL